MWLGSGSFPLSFTHTHTCEDHIHAHTVVHFYTTNKNFIIRFRYTLVKLIYVNTEI